MIITGSQIRAARALLGWSAMTLAGESGVAYAVIQRSESAKGVPGIRTQNLDRVQKALEAAGIRFIEGDDTGGSGVRLAR